MPRYFPPSHDFPADQFVQRWGPTEDIAKARSTTTRLVVDVKCTNWDRLRQLKRLHTLCLTGNASPEQLMDVSQLRQLRTLCLSDTRRDDFSPLSGPKGLRCLVFDNASGLQSLKFLKSLPNLEALAAQFSMGLSDLGPLAQLKKLKELYLMGGLFKSLKLESLRPLGKLHKLQFVTIAAKTNDDSLEALANLSELKDLDLSITFPMEEFAWLAGRLRRKKLAMFDPPYRTFDDIPCGRCGNSEGAFPLGRGKRRLCLVCQSQRLEEFVSDFEELRDQAAAGKFKPKRKKLAKKKPVKKKAAVKTKKKTKKRRLAKAGTTLLDLDPEIRAIVKTIRHAKQYVEIRNGAVDRVQYVLDCNHATAKMIGRLHTLKSLYLGSGNDRVMAELEDLKELEKLEMSRPSFSDKGMASIGKLPAMHNLRLYSGRTGVNDKNMKSIRPLRQLEHLTIFGAHISDASIPVLRSFRNLKCLYMPDTKFTDNGRDKLRKALPQCDISVD